MKILAVDDDPTALEIILAALEEAHYNDIQMAPSAHEALELIEAQATPFDCVLLDIMMPGMNGVELCERLRTMPEYDHTPIIMITAVNDQERLIEAIHRGATDYVKKPFDGLELGARLRAASILVDAFKTRKPPVTRNTCRKVAVLEQGDAIQLKAFPGATDWATLCDGLIAQTDDVAATHVFTFAIVNIEAIFRRQTQIEFRNVLNDVAKVTASSLEPWDPKFTYCGSGLFSVVLSCGGVASNDAVKQALRNSVHSVKIRRLAGHECSLRLSFAFSTRTGPRHGPAVLSDLSETRRRIQTLISHERHEAELKKLRNAWAHSYDNPETAAWFGGTLSRTQSGKSSLKPRRVVPKSKLKRPAN